MISSFDDLLTSSSPGDLVFDCRLFLVRNVFRVFADLAPPHHYNEVSLPMAVVNMRDKVVSRDDNNVLSDEDRHVSGQIGRTKEERSVES